MVTEILTTIYKEGMNLKMKIKLLIIIVILVLISSVSIVIFKQHKKSNVADVKVPILLYHDFVIVVPNSDPDNFNYINTPQSFEENIKTLLENGYTFISMEQLNNAINKKIELPSKPILLNMDDGYYSNYEYIYPIIKKYNVKASIFIVTDMIGKEIDGKKYLSWNECIEMQNSGLVEIFSHSKRHIFYNKFPIRTIRDDVTESFKIIEKNLGKKNLKVFSYPYGAYTKTSVLALKMIGIDMQVYNIGINYFNNFNKNYIKRINIPCEMLGREIIEEINKIN
ncbi:MAG: polysaccharide deacetylase family protein [Clostridia bacterium]